MNKPLQQRIFAALDGTINPVDFDALQDELETSEDARRLYFDCVELYESLGELESLRDVPNTGRLIEPTKQSIEHVQPSSESAETSSDQRVASARGWFSAQWFMVAAAILLVCTIVAFSAGRKSGSGEQETLASREASDSDQKFVDETMVAGHASLRRAIDVKWEQESTSFQSGDLIPAGRLALTAGVLELDFFCGATLVVEGPAELEIVSDWELTCLSGRLRANVPPAARGFVVNAAESKIVDLGTEFSLHVNEDQAQVEVIDGEVEIHDVAGTAERMKTGDRKWLLGDQQSNHQVPKIASVEELGRRRQIQLLQRKREWEIESQALRNDDRLIAYFPISPNIGDSEESRRKIRNVALTGTSRDGFFVGSVTRSSGRFADEEEGVRFAQPGSRIRVRMDGTFTAYTFAAWVRIDSLQHAYNALFMADGYENGEPHWQIDHQGRMMISVMVDQTEKKEHFSRFENAVVRAAGRHRVYFSPPIWDLSKSGRWMHLAAVFDPTAGRVRQYVDGAKVFEEQIAPEYMVRQLHIGAAEIGNWGQPSRKTPSFAVRNLDGTIDEMILFDAALSDQEISRLYEGGKP